MEEAQKADQGKKTVPGNLTENVGRSGAAAITVARRMIAPTQKEGRAKQ